MTSLHPTIGQWSKRFDDDSGERFLITYDLNLTVGEGYDGEILIKHNREITWPIEELDWLISRLQAIKAIAESHEMITS